MFCGGFRSTSRSNGRLTPFDPSFSSCIYNAGMDPGHIVSCDQHMIYSLLFSFCASPPGIPVAELSVVIEVDTIIIIMQAKR